MSTASLFSKRPLADWIADLQHAEAADDRYRALMAVHSLEKPEESIRWFRYALCDVDSTVRALAIKQLGEVKRAASPSIQESVWDDVVTELEPRLADADLDVRFEAARSLGRIKPTHAGAKEALLSLLDDDQTQSLMVAVVVSALSELSGTDLQALVPRYRKLITHDQAEVRENVSAAIVTWETAANALIPELIVALDDDEPIVRENAAIALGRSAVKNPDVLSALQRTESDEDELVAAAAHNALERLS